MDGSASPPTGYLAMTVWIDADPSVGARVRILRSGPGKLGEEVAAYAATAEEVCDIVRAWLEPLLAGGDVTAR
jgi:hypothetical protein